MNAFAPLFFFFAFLSAFVPAEEELEELFTTASLWQVGENVQKVDEARNQLIAFGEMSIRFIVEKKLALKGTLEFRAMQSVVQGVGEPSIPILLLALTQKNPVALRNAWNLLSLFPLKIVQKYRAKDKISEDLRRSLASDTPDSLKRSACEVSYKWAFSELHSVIADLVSRQETPDTVAIPCINALKQFASMESLPALFALLENSSAPKRFAAENALIGYGSPILPYLMTRITEIASAETPEHPTTLRHFLKILGAVSPEDSPLTLSLLNDFLNSEDWGIRASAVQALGTMGSEQAFALITKLAQTETHPYIRFLLQKYLSAPSRE